MKTLLSCVMAFTMIGAGSTFAAETSRPNIVLILADDCGLDNLSCYGSDKHQTPQIDKLAASGTRFSTCYASPLCGPTRCLLMTGRYAFRTGGILNSSWRNDGPGAKAADEKPMAKLLKEAGYATCQAGKWRQVGDTPRDWGFDEYCTDPTAGGWYWEDSYEKNGEKVTTPEKVYNPDVIHEFSLDFIRKNQAKPFFLYYAMHLVHGPIVKTPDTKSNVERGPELYDDNIAYMDKQVGSIVAELDKLGLREKTLVLFTTDNGTALNYPSSIGNRVINGRKGTMLEGGSRVPLIASWPGVTPAGKVSNDLISFADPLATFVELAGATLPTDVKYDGQSFAAQLRGEVGTPREWIYVQLGKQWYVRNAGWKMNEKGELFDMSEAPFVEKLVPKENESKNSLAARARLTKVLEELDPASGKTDTPVAAPKKKRKKAA